MRGREPGTRPPPQTITAAMGVREECWIIAQCDREPSSVWAVLRWAELCAAAKDLSQKAHDLLGRAELGVQVGVVHA
jgi:hypothetical protein